MKTRALTALSLFVLFTMAATAALAALPSDARRPAAPGADRASVERPTVVPGKLYVKFTVQAMPQVQIRVGKAGAAETGIASVDALAREARVQSVRSSFGSLSNPQLAEQIGLPRWHVLEIPADVDAEEMALRFTADPNVEVASADYEPTHDVVPNDPMHASNWGHNNTGQLLDYCWGCGGHPAGSPVGTPGFDARAHQAWDSPQGYGDPSVIIAIIDSDGADVDHPDLNVVGGWDYVNGDSNPDAVSDAHGTACAGIAAAIANNAMGVAGVAGGCGIMAFRTAFNADIANAITYAADNGADVASMSISWYGTTSLPIVDNAITYAYGQGVTLLSSSGNRNESTLWVPQNHPNVIAVGAASPCGDRKRSSSSGAEVNPGVLTDPNGYTCDGERWWGSSYGSTTQDAAGAVDVIAPTILPTTDILGLGGYETTDYTMWFNGTSCSTPYAAGVCALIKSLHPTWTPDQIRQRLRDTATDITNVESGAGWDRFSGYGMVNAGAAVALPDGVPWAPAGWGDVMVPTNVSGSTFDVAPFPASLPGDGTTYFNWQYANLGTDYLDNPNDRGYRDGVLIYNASGGNWAPFWRFGNLDIASTVSGGRHTIRTAIDPFDVILELNETNNEYARQFVWTPQPIAPNTLVSRAAPPEAFVDAAVLAASGNVVEVATDALQFVPNTGVGYWRAIGMHAVNNAENYELALLNPTTDIFTGQDNASWTGVQSLRGPGFTDIVLVNDNLSGAPLEVGMANLDGTASNNIIENRHSALPEFDAFLGGVESTSLAQDQMLLVRELYSSDAAQVLVMLDVQGAAQPATLSIFDPTFEMGSIGDAAFAAATDPAGHAEILLTPTNFEYYGIMVHRDPIDGSSPLNLTLTIRPPVTAFVEHRVPGEKTVYSVPDGSGLAFTEAWLWDGVPGSSPVPADGTIHVTVANAAGVAIPGFPAEDILMVGGTTVACPGGNIADGPTDASGVTTFTAPARIGGQIFSGYGTFTQVAIQNVPSASVSYGPASAINFNSPDINGDLVVNLVDVSRFSEDLSAGYNFRSDFFWNGVLNLQDVSRLAMSLAAGCGVPKMAAAKDAAVSGLIGVYFDREGKQRTATVASQREVSAYVMLTGPAAQRGISAWEAGIETSDNVVIRDVSLGDGHLNLGQDGDYIVGLGREMKAAEGAALHLATLRLMVTDDRPAEIRIGSSSLRSHGLDLPAVVVGLEGSELEAIGVDADAEGMSAATINDGQGPEIGQESEFAFSGYRLANVPNPFNPATEIRFELPRRGRVDVRIYDVAGRQVRELGGESLPAGPGAVRWSGTDQRNAGVVSGTYYYKLFLDGESVGAAKRMTLLK